MPWWLTSIITSGWTLTGLTVVPEQVMAAALMEISPGATPVKKINHQVRAGAETKAEYLIDKHGYI